MTKTYVGLVDVLKKILPDAKEREKVFGATRSGLATITTNDAKQKIVNALVIRDVLAIDKYKKTRISNFDVLVHITERFDISKSEAMSIFGASVEDINNAACAYMMRLMDKATAYRKSHRDASEIVDTDGYGNNFELLATIMRLSDSDTSINEFTILDALGAKSIHDINTASAQALKEYVQRASAYVKAKAKAEEREKAQAQEIKGKYYMAYTPQYNRMEISVIPHDSKESAFNMFSNKGKEEIILFEYGDTKALPYIVSSMNDRIVISGD